MLSNAEMIIMRFVKMRPSYAYEIESTVEKRKFRQWVKIGGATIYQALDRLQKKGFLDYLVEREGNMPERKRYFINEKGDEALLKSVKEILANIEPYYFDLSIGLACRGFIDKEEFHELIGIRLRKLNQYINNFNEMFEKSKELYPEKNLIMRDYLLGHYRLEQELLEKLLQDTGNDKGGDEYAGTDASKN